MVIQALEGGSKFVFFDGGNVFLNESFQLTLKVKKLMPEAI